VFANFPEEDFWPGTTSDLSVTCPRSPGIMDSTADVAPNAQGLIERSSITEVHHAR
jgi:hypothetical protein